MVGEGKGFVYRSADRNLATSAARRPWRRDGRLLSVFLLVLLAPGCASIGKEATAEQVSRIEIGKSTKDTVLRTLGLPNRREVKSSKGSERLEFWIYHKGSGRTVVWIPVPVPVGGGTIVTFLTTLEREERSQVAAIIAFDEQGIVRDVKSGGE